MESEYLFGFAVLVTIVLIGMFVSYMKSYTKQDSNCERLAKLNEPDHMSITTLNNQRYFTKSVTIKSTNIDYDLKVKDFYIKTAYNACCSGRIKNDYVDLCALENCAKQGVRALDLQIFSLDNTPIVASSTSDSNFYKESYNHLDFSDVAAKINSYFLSGGKNKYNKLKDDPLFLCLRLHYGGRNSQMSDSDKTSKLNFYNSIHNILKSKLGNNYNNFFCKTFPTTQDTTLDARVQRIVTSKMSSMKNKIVLFVSITDSNTDILKESKLYDIVDGVSGHSSDKLISHRYNDIQDSSNLVQMAYNNQQALSLCLPSKGEITSKNYDFTNLLHAGIQFLAMNFQSEDTYLKYYNDMFKYNDNKSNVSVSYVKKPDNLIMFPRNIMSNFKN